MIERSISPAILQALQDNPVVMIVGSRQTGKTTLVRQLARGPHPARYLTLDDAGVLSAARSDPIGFIGGIAGPVILDEIQKAPELLPAIKMESDRRRQPGRFLLTGSANVLLLPRLSESLAGRMEILTLWPFSQQEIEGTSVCFVDAVFGKMPVLTTPPEAFGALAARIVRGGYPEVVQARPLTERRAAWFGSYILTLLQRDVRDIMQITGLTDLPRLLSLIAARAGAMQNFSDLSRSSTIPQTTLKRYMTLLETTFLIYTLQPWSTNLGKRWVKTPRHFLADTGLLAHLIGVTEERLAAEAIWRGPLLENFVLMELVKQAGWSRTQPRIYYFRTPTGHEVDMVLESRDGRIAGIEVKASSTVSAKDVKGLQILAEKAGPRFTQGIVLYTGAEMIPFGKKFHAVPIRTLWS